MKDQTRTHSAVVLAILACALALQAQQPTTLQLTPGETKTLTRDKLTSGVDTLLVHATAGQTLFIEMKFVGKLQEAGSADRFQVFAPDAARAFKSSMGEDEDSLHWLNTLPQAGDYKIVVNRPSKKPYTLAVTLLDASDARLNPGLTADQVHLDLSGLGINKPLSPQPFVPVISDEMLEPWPAHLGVVVDNLEIHILSVEGMRKAYGGQPEFAKQLERFLAAVQNKTPFLAKNLPLSPYEDAGVDLAMRQEVLEGKSFKGIRWIATFTQEEMSAPTNPLTYVFEGISRDGKYFLEIRADMTHPSLLASGQDLPKDLWQPGPKLTAMRKQTALNIAKAAPNSFTPDLNKLDAIVQSLQLP